MCSAPSSNSKVDAHLVHLGTMGVYGYGTAGMKIPEGYLKVFMNTDDGDQVEQEILYPFNPGSIYHMTKTQDQLFFHFYNKNDGVKITDLHQGIVWGTQTPETKMDERLVNRFDYDGDYGTVLNRFLMQAAIGYPLTVHGIGRPDARVHPYSRHLPLHRARHREPAAKRRAREHPQSDDGDAPGPRPGQARLRDDRHADPVPAESAQRGEGERPPCHQRPIPADRASSRSRLRTG